MNTRLQATNKSASIHRLYPPLNRRFEAILFDWHGTAVTNELTDAGRLRTLVEALCAAGMYLAVISDAGVEDVDGQLQARPSGPGRLYVCPDGGSNACVVFGDAESRIPSLQPRHMGSERTDRSNSVSWMLDELWSIGVGAGLVLIVGDDFGTRGGLAGRDASMLVPRAARATAASVGLEPDGVPRGVIRLGGGPDTFLRLLQDQLHRRRERSVPEIDLDPAWIYHVREFDHESEGAQESLLSIADGQFGTAGAPLDSVTGATPRVLAAGVYLGEGGVTELLPCPSWDRSGCELVEGSRISRTLDLRAGILIEETVIRGEVRRAFRFSSFSQPGTMVLRAEGSRRMLPKSPPLADPQDGQRLEAGGSDSHPWMKVRSTPGGVVAAASEVRSVERGLSRLERLSVYVSGPRRCPRVETAVRSLAEVEAKGFDSLLAAHRARWARRWADADIRIEGDPELELAIRFALFHLMCSVASVGEAAVGARGLSGRAYRGHVFWDSDVYVLPFLAATHPPAARAMLEYRVQRLPAARASARGLGRKGARFPWESALTGSDVTPRLARGADGREIEIRTGFLEEHIVADVAWAAQIYVDWSNDRSFSAGPGRTIILETARYWASRIRIGEDGRAHIYGVIGPDEYHEAVDDNAFTNVMARWNLRRATQQANVSPGKRDSWRELARLLVDGFDRRSGLYEQFAGFWKLEPLIIKDLAPRRPVAADLLLGTERVRAAQVIKQADVLMLHLMVPDSIARGSLAPNLDFYEPRTAHGSSLSPGVHAALLARAGRMSDALETLRMTARLDLDDLTGTSAGGLHLATMGSLWLALVHGFAGVRPTRSCLAMDPHLPPSWQALEIPLHFHGARLRLRIEPEVLKLWAERPLTVRFAGATPRRVPAGISTYRRDRSGWGEVRP